MTLGSSKTVLEFLYAAKEKKRSFKVFVAEGAPRLVVVPISYLQRMLITNRFVYILLMTVRCSLCMQSDIRDISLRRNWLLKDYRPQ